MIITNINGIGATKIQPIRAKYSDSTDCTMLSVRATDDNFLDTATLTWKLMRYTNEGWQISDQNTITVSGDIYASWDGNNETPFLIIAQLLNLTIIE